MVSMFVLVSDEFGYLRIKHVSPSRIIILSHKEMTYAMLKASPSYTMRALHTKLYPQNLTLKIKNYPPST
jgi:hypothetical protein